MKTISFGKQRRQSSFFARTRPTTTPWPLKTSRVVDSNGTVVARTFDASAGYASTVDVKTRI
jgi:hypothetical protein